MNLSKGVMVTHGDQRYSEMSDAGIEEILGGDMFSLMSRRLIASPLAFRLKL